MEALLAFAAALLSLRLAALLAARWRDRRRPELAAWSAALLAYAIASAALAWGAAAGWDTRPFRVYYLFGGLLTAPLLGLGSLLLYGWRRIVGPALVYVGLGGRSRDLGARSRRLRRRHPRGAGPSRFLPRPVPRGRCKRHRNAGRSRCGTPHDQAQAGRQCAHRRRGRRCRRWHRSIRLGCCENGGFCGNCSTSSLRRFYSLQPPTALTNRYRPGLTRLTSIPGAFPGLARATAAQSVRAEHGASDTRGFLLYRRLLRLLPALIITCLAFAALTVAHQASAGGKTTAGHSRRRRPGPADRPLPQADVALAEADGSPPHAGDPRGPATARAASTSVWVRDLWKRRAVRAHRKAHNPPHKAGWLCIHRHEGPWNDPNAPYYGGLQMDIGFQRTYGARPPPPQGHRGQLDAARADVGRRARAPQRSGLLPVAQHRALLRADLGPQGVAKGSLANEFRLGYCKWDEARGQFGAGAGTVSGRRRSA